MSQNPVETSSLDATLEEIKKIIKSFPTDPILYQLIRLLNNLISESAHKKRKKLLDKIEEEIKNNKSKLAKVFKIENEKLNEHLAKLREITDNAILQDIVESKKPAVNIRGGSFGL